MDAHMGLLEMGLPKFRTRTRRCRLAPQTTTSGALSPHGPADALKASTIAHQLTYVPTTPKETNRASFVQGQGLPTQNSAIFILPVIFQQDEWLCTITPMHRGGIINVSRRGNKTTMPIKRKHQ